MRFRPTSWRSARASFVRRTARGFTLAEVLTALAFTAIVIPVAVYGVRVANTVGQVAERKSVAVRVADRVLNELVVTGDWKQSAQSGSVEEGVHTYRWQLRTESWGKDGMRQLSLVVTYQVQGQDYEVRIATLLDTTQE
jgi:type II secretory pathway pseudopilin PulG